MPDTTEEALIRERLEALAEAIRAKDIDALMAHYAPDVVVFDLMPLQTKGAEAYAKNFQRWFAAVEGPIDYEIDYEMRELTVAVRDDLALCHYVAHVNATRTGGVNSDYWVRVTAGLRKRNGAWLVTHEHISLPFPNAAAMQAALRGGG